MALQYLLPAEGDNAGIATRRLEAGEALELDGNAAVLKYPVPQGHRICISPIPKGEALLSWGLSFGTATEDIAFGDYLCNAKMHEVLRARQPEDYDDQLKVNFEDKDTIAERTLPEAPSFGNNVADIVDGLTFQGFYRGESRGWGTRNYLVIIGATSRSRSAVLEAAERLQTKWPAYGNFDGVVPVVHTEGGGLDVPNNRDLLLRTLAGFATNPNSGAAILVSEHGAWLTNDEIAKQVSQLDLPEDEYRISYKMANDDGFFDSLVRECELLIPQVESVQRQPAPVSGLKLGLQCGGSDAFSGVTANQVLGKAVHELIRRGGSANLAETDELIGAEQYVLQKTASKEIFERFLTVQQRFKDYATAHGHTAEGNVSGGNIYRGLYNITLKSIGAARKKDPQTHLDYVIDYAQPMRHPGYYFMDSPGNDLESIAGQVAAGANVVLFTTGNGSITNFPFVPTLKIVTTHERFQLLESDMDFDAGQVLEGESLELASGRLRQLLLETASGIRSKGEHTGQYQTQIWRNAFFPTANQLIPTVTESGPRFSGVPLIAADRNDTLVRARSEGAPMYSLVLPTSLCSGQVAEQIAAHINRDGNQSVRERAIALPHTEGCGVSGGQSEEIFRDTMIGYATHPLVKRCVFLEHGCEKTHNDYFQSALNDRGITPGQFDWASIQLEGGISAVSQHVEKSISQPSPSTELPRLPLQVGLTTSPGIGHDASQRLADLAHRLLSKGVGVVLAANDPLLKETAFCDRLALNDARPTLAYSQQATDAGLHVMDCSTSDWLEIATGLGATGCRCLITVPTHYPYQPHRFIPTLQLSPTAKDEHFDSVLVASDEENDDALTEQVFDTLAGAHTPLRQAAPNVGFQISRGRFGVSL